TRQGLHAAADLRDDGRCRAVRLHETRGLSNLIYHVPLGTRLVRVPEVIEDQQRITRIEPRAVLMGKCRQWRVEKGELIRLAAHAPDDRAVRGVDLGNLVQAAEGDDHVAVRIEVE